MRHSYDSAEMYGENYGYRSGLNQSMVAHLRAKVQEILARNVLFAGDLIIDIGSNDGTLLSVYPNGYVPVGIDPTGAKFQKYYPPHVQLIPDFFNADLVRQRFPGQKAKVITSIAMFYDLESPLDFMRQIHQVLDDNGIWVFEQSYLPTMLDMNSYDTACHEHIEYYRLRQIQWMAQRVGFRILDVSVNAVNGGSFSITMAKTNSKLLANQPAVDQLRADENRQELDTLRPYAEFKQRVFRHRNELKNFIAAARASGQVVAGYGASTKGNVLLQFCNFTVRDIPYIAEVNPDKFGALTPGTSIPIISENEARSRRPDYFLVLPWHFRENILAREQQYLANGGKFLFPLPAISVVPA
jgi:hypothetical protein